LLNRQDAKDAREPDEMGMDRRLLCPGVFGVLAVSLLVAIGCGSASNATHAGAVDAGVVDAAVDSASVVAPDAGSGDDASPDASTDDAAVPDAGPPVVDVPVVRCSDAIADVYVTPTSLLPMTPANRGDVVRCAKDVDLDRATIDARIAAAGVVGAVPTTTGVATYRIEFRTTRADGSDGASTAIVFLPHTPLAVPAPLVVVGHPTTGVADPCAPSRTNEGLDNLALPWAAAGYVVVVPDYAGLGNGGVQRYLDARDTGQTLLDAARAMRKLLDARALASRHLGVGFSQGGGGALSMQALDRTYGDGALAGVVAISPEFQTRANSFGFVDMMRSPTGLTILTGISKCVVTVMRSYAYFASTAGMAHAGDMFPASNRDGLVSETQSLCFLPLGGYVQGVAPLLGELFDDTFRTGFLSCVDGGACSGESKTFFDYLSANIVPADPRGAPILYVQGLLDSIMRPDEEAACNVVKLQADGVTPLVCADAASDHGSAPTRNIMFATKWAAAILAGNAPPACETSGVLPPCNP
jgi:hypothetical protein